VTFTLSPVSKLKGNDMTKEETPTKGKGIRFLRQATFTNLTARKYVSQRSVIGADAIIKTGEEFPIEVLTDVGLQHFLKKKIVVVFPLSEKDPPKEHASVTEKRARLAKEAKAKKE